MEADQHNNTSAPASKPHETNDFNEEKVDMMKFAKMMKYAKVIKQQIFEKLENHSYKDKPMGMENYHKRVRKWVSSTIINGKSVLKWLIIVLNVVVELWQVILAQEAANGLIDKPNYVKLCVISSCICFTISICDIVFEVREGDVKWRRRGVCFWMYYPGKQGRMFGNIWLLFGLVSSIVQLFFNSCAYVSKKPGFLGFDYLPLLLSVCFFIAAFGNGKRSLLGVVKCNDKHGKYEIEGRFVHGRWVFECPSCKVEASI